jgi:hypothetical protein
VNARHTSSPRLAQSRLLTYRLLPSSITSLPNSFSNFFGASFLGSSFSNGHPESWAGGGAAELEAVDGAVTVLGGAGGRGGKVADGWVGEILDADAADAGFSAFCPLRCSITPSSRRKRDNSSASGGRLDLRGARPGGGKMQSTPALTQLEQGERLLQRTFRRRQVTQLRALAISETGRGAVASTPERALFGEFSLAEGEFSPPSGEAEWNDMTTHRGRPKLPAFPKPGTEGLYIAGDSGGKKRTNRYS